MRNVEPCTRTGKLIAVKPVALESVIRVIGGVINGIPRVSLDPDLLGNPDLLGRKCSACRRADGAGRSFGEPFSYGISLKDVET